MRRNRGKSGSEEVKETPGQKFLREREEKLAKKKRREERRKARLQKPKDMSGAFPHTPGIYKLVNKRTGEVFVSYSQRMAGGIQNHLFWLERGRHKNLDLQEDWDNGDRFDVVILKEYMDYDKELLEKEVVDFIEAENSFHCGYNRSSGEHPGTASIYTGRRLDGSRNRSKRL